MMARQIAEFWARRPRGPLRPVDVEARLVVCLENGGGALTVAHGAWLVLCAWALLQMDGSWSGALSSGGLLVLALRACVLRRIRRLPVPASDPSRWRIPYQTVELAWSAMGAALCFLCATCGGDEPIRLMAVFVSVAVSGGIALTWAGSPRLTITRIFLWLLPSLGVATPHEPRSLIVPLMAALDFVALCTVVQRRAAEIRARGDANVDAEIQRLKTALAAQDLRLRGIFDNAAAGFAEVDLGTERIVRVNKVFCDMVGRTEADLLGMTDISELNHPDDRVHRAEQWAGLRKTGQSFECERRYRASDGSLVWGRISVSVVATDAQGKPLRVLSVVQDITARKEADAALHASQDLLRLSLDIGGVGTFRRDYVAGFIYCGRETRQMLGLPVDDTPVTGDLWFSTMLAEDQPRFLKAVADFTAERREIVTYDYRFMHPQRGLRFAETRSRVDYDAAGRRLTSVGVVIDVTDRRRTESRLAHMAHHDPLTDLPNRSLFRLRLDEALHGAREGGQCAVLCLDLDHFKEVNDTFGHATGDALLRVVTERLQNACRASDTVARLGGDEFAVIQAPLNDDGEAAVFAQRLVSILSAPYQIDGRRITIGASAGIAVAPADGTEPERLLRNADVALYEAKSAGRGRHQRFATALDERLQAGRLLDADLRQAVANGAFEVFYQPLVSVATRRIRGFEALVRWRHPERGLVMPDQFIPLAEANGLIVPIGAFVLQEACNQAARWTNGASVAVNLSASEFGSHEIVETVAAALRRSALDPRRLELEITETTMLHDTKATLETLERLKALGVGISIDDFGTGFSSLSYLQRFPFDKVKIDRSFIAPLGRTRESLAIVGAVANLCAGLDMQTTAEGVETEEQLAILSDLGCTEAQGYYFSQPCPASDIEAIIETVGRAANRHREAVAA